MEKHFYAYMLASQRYGTLYLGVTADLAKRVWQHKNEVVDGFTKTYRVKQLVWYEVHSDRYEAMTRERQLKQWRRAWKIRLINAENPFWRDLSEDFTF